MSNGDTIWAWQGRHSTGWSTIMAKAGDVRALTGMNTGALREIVLYARERQVMIDFQPLAEQCAEALGQELRLARFELAEVEAEFRP